jgi:hypothetical protein
MRIASIIATAAAGAALLIGPGLAAGDPPVGSPSGDHSAAGTHPANKQQPPSTPGPTASAGAKAKAYGRFCQGQSKKHVKGQKGTPFSQCVTAMAKLANGQVKSAKAACKLLSKKHVKGLKGTPFSLCVRGAGKLHAETSS